MTYNVSQEVVLLVLIEELVDQGLNKKTPSDESFKKVQQLFTDWDPLISSVIASDPNLKRFLITHLQTHFSSTSSSLYSVETDKLSNWFNKLVVQVYNQDLVDAEAVRGWFLKDGIGIGGERGKELRDGAGRVVKMVMEAEEDESEEEEEE
jgi:hypothetical protein